jgi:hypothetical protein
VKTTRPRAAAILIEWGHKVEQSKTLVNTLGIADRIAWVPPQNAAGMAAYIKASDVLADQFFLGAWGSTMPRALYFGTPAMLYVNESVHRWCFPEMPPVVNTGTSEEVYDGLCRLLDENYRRDLTARGRAWYDTYHSNGVIAEGFIGAMRDVLAPDQARRTSDLARGLRDAQITALTIGQDVRRSHAAYEKGQAAAMTAYEKGQAAAMTAYEEGQAALMRAYHERQTAQAERLRQSTEDLQASLAAVNRKQQDIQRQLGFVLEIVNELKPAIPMLQRAALVSRLLLGPPYRVGRFLYGLLTKPDASGRS